MIYQKGQSVLILVTVEHIEPQMCDGHPTGENVIVVDKHWRMSEKHLHELELLAAQNSVQCEE